MAQRIRDCRKSFKLTQKELAEKLYNNGDWITLEDYLGITSEYAD